MQNKDLTAEGQLCNAIKGNLESLPRDYGELALDNFLPDGIIRDIPGLSSLSFVYKVCQGVRDALFAKKMLNFLYEIADTPKEERIEFIRELEKNVGTQQKVGEQLIFLIERADSISKAKIIGKIYKGCITKKLDPPMLRRLSFIVDRCFLEDIKYLNDFANNREIPKAAKESLYGVGLLSFGGVDGGTWDGQSDGMMYRSNATGDALLSILDEP